MAAYNLIIGIVPRNYGEVLAKSAVDAGANGGTIVMGRGTAANSFLQLIGFGDAAKDLIYVLTPDDLTEKIKDAMIEATKEKKRPFGIIFTVSASSFVKAGAVFSQAKEIKDMANDTTHDLITIIVNKGFADDAMDAARKAGASGGTIINARGTAREGDGKFFGVEIVPEKDMIFILSDKNKSEDILNAVRTLPCLAKPGSGIAFTSPAEGFTVLGRD